MKKTLYLISIVAAMATACKKSNDFKTTQLASINITNATLNSEGVVANFTPNKVPFAGSPNVITFGANLPLAMIAGTVPITVTDLTDTTKVAWQQTVNVANGSYYSLFLSGQTGQIDAILVKDTYKNYADSICGVRFINLSPGSNAISVNITGNANGTEIPSLAYKANSGFKQYTANSTITSYSFDFRDATTGNLLVTYSLTTPMFHNVTLALIGLENGSGVAVEQINNY